MSWTRHFKIMTQIDVELKETELSTGTWQRQSSIQEKDNVSPLKKILKEAKADLRIANTHIGLPMCQHSSNPLTIFNSWSQEAGINFYFYFTYEESETQKYTASKSHCWDKMFNNLTPARVHEAPKLVASTKNYTAQVSGLDKRKALGIMDHPASLWAHSITTLPIAKW